MMNDRILVYEVFYNNNIEALIETVNQKIGEGWQPFGEPFVTPENETHLRTFFQAMVVYESTATEEEN